MNSDFYLFTDLKIIHVGKKLLKPMSILELTCILAEKIYQYNESKLKSNFDKNIYLSLNSCEVMLSAQFTVVQIHL